MTLSLGKTTESYRNLYQGDHKFCLLTQFAFLLVWDFVDDINHVNTMDNVSETVIKNQNLVTLHTYPNVTA